MNSKLILVCFLVAIAISVVFTAPATGGGKAKLQSTGKAKNLQSNGMAKLQGGYGSYGYDYGYDYGYGYDDYYCDSYYDYDCYDYGYGYDYSYYKRR